MDSRFSVQCVGLLPSLEYPQFADRPWVARFTDDDAVLEKALIASFQEAVKISGIAADVLERDLQNPRVQSMVNHVLGPSDGPNFQENIETAKCESVSRFVHFAADQAGYKSTSGTWPNMTRRKLVNLTLLAV